MKTWKRNMVVAVILLFVCAAVYLNWSYSQEVEAGTQSAGGKLLGEATLVSDISDDPLLETADQDSALSVQEQEQTGYFSAARLNRQQARDSALSLLQEAAGDETADQVMRDEANNSIQTMAAYTLSEAQVENLITAKGYEDCICFIGDSSASVVVAAVEGGLTDTDTARIMEIVKEETGLTAAQIKIIEAEQ
jgi:stage III sporulation protein AH